MNTTMNKNNPIHEVTRLENMRAEHAEMLDRYIKLERFTLTEEFLNLSKESQNKLIQQGIVIHLYLRILRSRIMDCVKGGLVDAKTKDNKEKNPDDRFLSEITACTAARPGSCDKCPLEHTDCKKIILADGSHLCMVPPIRFKENE
jgi:hypothetical protein